MRACLVPTVPNAIPRRIGLLRITARIRALRMKAEGALITATHPVVRVTHRHFVAQPVLPVTTVTIQGMGAGNTINSLPITKTARAVERRGLFL